MSRNRSLLILIILIFAAPLLAQDLLNKPNVRIFLPVDPTERNMPVIDWLENEKWCWGVEVTPYVSEKDIRNLRSQGFNVPLLMVGHKETLERDCGYKNFEVPDINEVVKKHISAAYGQPGNVYWIILMEDDSAGVAHPQTLLKEEPETYQQAYKLFEKHIDESLYSAKDFPDVHLWGLCGYASAAHMYAKNGVECTILERSNDDVEDLQTGIAFTRGAAKQYGTEWGVDFSLWWGVIYGCIQDLPTSYHRRQFFVSYMSGAKTFRIEGGDLFWDHENDKLYKLASTVNEFGRFTEKYDPGNPIIPVAVILPEDHGWISPPYWSTTNTAWNYAKIPYRQGARPIDGFFGRFFPGNIYAMQPFPFGKYEIDDPPASPFALSCIVPRFAPSKEDVFYAEPPLPFGRFKTRNEARQQMHALDIDTSPYRPMANSTYGDILDVFTDDVKIDVLNDYKALFVLGQVKLTAEKKKMLVDYAKNGGTVVWSAGVITPDDEDICGVELSPEYRVARAWQWEGYYPNNEAFHYLPAKPQNTIDVKVLAATPGGDPLVIRKRVGKGYIYTCTVPWFEGAYSKMAGVARKLMDVVIEPFQPTAVEGLPVEWITAESDDQRTVMISNNSHESWKGVVTTRDIPRSFDTCTDLLTMEKVKFNRKNNDAVVEVEIEPFDMVILRWQQKKSPRTSVIPFLE